MALHYSQFKSGHRVLLSILDFRPRQIEMLQQEIWCKQMRLMIDVKNCRRAGVKVFHPLVWFPWFCLWHTSFDYQDAVFERKHNWTSKDSFWKWIEYTIDNSNVP
jgi:hypothetical protein